MKSLCKFCMIVLIITLLLTACDKGDQNPGNPNGYKIPGEHGFKIGDTNIMIIDPEPTPSDWKFPPWDK